MVKSFRVLSDRLRRYLRILLCDLNAYANAFGGPLFFRTTLAFVRYGDPLISFAPTFALIFL